MGWTPDDKLTLIARGFDKDDLASALSVIDVSKAGARPRPHRPTLARTHAQPSFPDGTVLPWGRLGGMRVPADI